MLHEPAGRNSATRQFRGRPVLTWTLDRLARSRRLSAAAVLCWDDQSASVTAAVNGADVRVISNGPRTPIPQIESIAAARRWADGWRGGLLGTCAFDVGFHGPAVRDAAAALDAVAVVLIDPAAGLVDPALLDEMIDHAAAHPANELCFTPAAPGLGGPLLRRPLLDRLAAGGTHPGRLLHYHPDVMSREPLSSDMCAPTPVPVARSTDRFVLDSDRQIVRITAAVEPLNGELMASSAEGIVRRVQAADSADALPREVVLELNTRRLSRPVFWPGRHLDIRRPDLSTETARVLFGELAAAGDVRLTLAGVGDPLLSANVFEIVAAAKEAGLAVHVETDLLAPDTETIRLLVAAEVDVVSFHLPALTEGTYAVVMGSDGWRRVLENVHAFVAARSARGRGVPLLVPLFVKCRDNLGEMEAWYDQWLRALGCAAVTGPSDFGGQIPDVAVADMAPPRRTPCARLAGRMTILSDGQVVSCEQDVLGRHPLGRVGEESIETIWRTRFGALRADHRREDWAARPLCAACREWHRP